MPNHKVTVKKSISDLRVSDLQCGEYGEILEGGGLTNGAIVLRTSQDIVVDLSDGCFWSKVHPAVWNYRVRKLQPGEELCIKIVY